MVWLNGKYVIFSHSQPHIDFNWFEHKQNIMIKVISFDVDGTLTKEKTDFAIWNIEIPKLYARAKNISLGEAKRYVYSEYYKGEYVEPTNHWTDIIYWFMHFGLDNSDKLLQANNNHT